MQLIVVMNHIASSVVKTEITSWMSTESRCKETYHVQHVDLVFDENAKENQVVEDVNKENIEESDWEEKTSDLTDQVCRLSPIILKVPIETLE